MFRNMFGEPRPKGIGQIDQALVEVGLPNNEDMDVSICYNAGKDCISIFMRDK